MKNFNAKTKMIVDLKKMEIVEVGELAAEAKTNTSRFSWPEEVTLTIDATDNQREDLKRAIDFNNGFYYEEMKEEIAGLQFIDESVKEEKPVKVKKVEAKQETVKAPEIHKLDFSGLTLPQLKKYAQNNNIDLKGLTSKADIKLKLEQK